MSGNLEDIHLALPDLLSDFESIQNSNLTSLQASRAIAKCFRERLDLYYSIVTLIEGNLATFDTIYGSPKAELENDIQNYLAHVHQPKNIPDHVILSKVISDKALRLATLPTKEDPTFSSALLPSASSWVWFPIIKQGKVISVIELGSETIMEHQNNWNDEEINKAFILVFETLQLKINRVLENTREEE